MNIVLFLGAGFSAEFDLPVMNQFFGFAEDSERLDEDERIFLDKLRRDAREANSFLESSPTNLEDILSISLMKNRLAYGMPYSNKNEISTRKILGKIYTKVNKVDSYWEQFESFYEFLLQYFENQEKHKLSIITTNYDLSIECALIKNNVYADPIIKYKNLQLHNKVHVTNILYNKNGVSLFKLHGSVNWFKSKNNNSITIDNRIVRVDGQNIPYNSLPYVCTRNYWHKDGISEPLIIPPSYLKPDLINPIKQIWAGASKALSEANLLVIVGYSFPMTDIEMKYFLANSLTNNVNLRQIQIINPKVAEIVKKIEEPNSKFGSHFKGLIFKNDNKWAKTKIDLNV